MEKNIGRKGLKEKKTSDHEEAMEGWMFLLSCSVSSF